MLFLSIAFACAAQDFAAQYEQRLRALDDEIVSRRLEIAQWLRDQALQEWARWEYEKILAHSPHHDEARTALGYVLRGDHWVHEVGQGLPARNTAEEHLLPGLAQAYWVRLDPLGAEIAAAYVELARWCQAQEASAQVADLARLALAYDPSNRAAASLLAWRPAAILPVPVHPDAVDLLGRARSDLQAVALGEPCAVDEAWADDVLRPRMRVSRGPHVATESTYMAAEWLASLVQTGEHALSITERLLSLPSPPSNEPPVWLVFVNDYEYEHLVRWRNRGRAEEEWAHTLRYRSGLYDNAESLALRKHVYDEAPLYQAAHKAAQFTVFHRLGLSRDPSPAGARTDWLWEGAAILIEWLTTSQSEAWCHGGPGTGDRGERNHYRMLAAAVAATFEDRPVASLTTEPIDQLHANSGMAKAASLLEWLACRYRDKLPALLRDLVATGDLEQTIRAQFGWSLTEFDEFWRRWARAAYAGERAEAPPVEGDYHPSEEWCACRFCASVRRRGSAPPPHLWHGRITTQDPAASITKEHIRDSRFGGRNVTFTDDRRAVQEAARGRRQYDYRLSEVNLRSIRRALPRRSTINVDTLAGLTSDVAIVDRDDPLAFFAIETLGPSTWTGAAPSAATIDRWTATARAAVLLDAPLHLIVPKQHHRATVGALQAILRDVYTELGRENPPDRTAVDPLVWTWRHEEP